MTNLELETRIRDLVREERKITNEILRLIAIAERRKLFLELGFGSLVDWLVKGLGYSERAAVRRVQASRLVAVVPESSSKLESGELNLTNLAKAQSAIRAQEKVEGVSMAPEKKREIVACIEKKSGVEAERVLMSELPAFASSVKADRTMQVSAEETRLAFNVPNELLADLERVKEILSHVMPGASYAEVIAYLAKEFLKRKDPAVKQRASAAPAQVLREAGAACEYKDPRTGQVCGSKHQVQVDHIKPRALGGTDGKSNLRALCRQHNIFMAEKILGWERANAWRASAPAYKLKDKPASLFET